MAHKTQSVLIKSDRIKKMLKTNNLKQIDLALEIGYAPESVSRFLRVGKVESDSVLDKICKFLDVDPHYVMGDIDIPYPYPQLPDEEFEMSDEDIELAFKQFNNFSEAYEYLLTSMHEVWKRLRQSCPEGADLEDFVKKHLILRIK